MTSEPGTTPLPPTHPVLAGRYALRAELASGGMASVFLAELRGLHGFEKVVAVKRIHPHLAKNRRFVSMFLDEARLVGLIQHPNICTIIDFGEDRGVPFLVMEYLSGEPFSAVIKAMRTDDVRPYWLAARVAHDTARGLHAAHELVGADGEPVGVVHRDVSPQNIVVLYDGVTKVVDFGVARARGRLAGTNTSELKGKISYMSPEQLNAQATDRRTDVWALGVVLWESTVGRRLFRADSDGATVNLVLNSVVPQPTEFEPDYPAELEAIVMRCLEREPEARFASAEELADALERFLYRLGMPAGATQVGRWMETRFAERIARQEAFLRGETEVLAPHDGTSLESELRPRPPSSSLMRDAGATAVARPLPSPVPPEETPESTPVRAAPVLPRSHLRRLALAAAVALALLAFALSTRRVEEPPPARAPHPPPAAAAAPEPASERPSGPSANGPVAMGGGEEDRAGDEVVDPELLVFDLEATPSEPAAEATAETTPAPERRSHRRVRRRPPRSSASRTTPVNTPVERGTLNLMAIPYAAVYLDGSNLGDTPLVRVSLPAGEHRLVLRGADGRTKTVNVRIRSGELTRLRVEL